MPFPKELNRMEVVFDNPPFPMPGKDGRKYKNNPPSAAELEAADTAGLSIKLVYGGMTYSRRVEPDDLMTMREAATALGITVPAVTKAAKAGQLKRVSRGGRLCVTWREVRRYGRKRGILPTSGIFLVG